MIGEESQDLMNFGYEDIFSTVPGTANDGSTAKGHVHELLLESERLESDRLENGRLNYLQLGWAVFLANGRSRTADEEAFLRWNDLLKITVMISDFHFFEGVHPRCWDTDNINVFQNNEEDLLQATYSFFTRITNLANIAYATATGHASTMREDYISKAAEVQNSALKEAERLEALENAAKIAEQKLRERKERERLQQRVFQYAIGSHFEVLFWLKSFVFHGFVRDICASSFNFQF